MSAGEATIGDESTDRLLVVGSTQMQQALVVDGNVTLGTGINDCSDNSAYCNAMLALESTVRRLPSMLYQDRHMFSVSSSRGPVIRVPVLAHVYFFFHIVVAVLPIIAQRSQLSSLLRLLQRKPIGHARYRVLTRDLPEARHPS